MGFFIVEKRPASCDSALMSALVQLSRIPTVALRPTDLPRVEVPGLYVHVPFCFHKCHYCDFYSITRQTPERMNRFVDLILSEADQWTAAHSPIVRPRTIFFGGGTPSLLPPEMMRRLIDGLRARFDFSLLEEFTCEVNPATADYDYCRMLRESGVDRISLGAQSFNRDELRMLERHHDPQDVPRALDIARRAEFSRLNVDLIYAVPGQSLDSWAASLDAAVALGTPHISAYNLTYEPNTAMAVRLRLGEFTATEESLELVMLHHARRRLAAAGMTAYEISNHAVPGEACRHNLLYWTGASYVGLGPSAASHVAAPAGVGHRFKNRPHLGEWETAVAAGGLPVIEHEIMTPRQRLAERVMLALRLAQGVNEDACDDLAAGAVRDVYAVTIAHLGKLGLLAPHERGFHLTEAGINVADAVAAEFLRSDNV